MTVFAGGFHWQEFFLGLAAGVAVLGITVSMKLEAGRRDHSAERLARTCLRWKNGR